MSEPKLRPVRSVEGEPSQTPRPPARGRTRRPSGGEILLAIALLMALALLVWSRNELGGRIHDLQAEAQTLRTVVVERERVIDAQRGRLDAQKGRLDEVRDHVDRLGALLDQPLPSIE